jgi:hypothetical protein
MPEIIVFGSLNMDLVVLVPRVPDAGETLQANSLMNNPGGKGATRRWPARARPPASRCSVASAMTTSGSA